MPDEPTDGPNDVVDRFHVETVPVSDPTNVAEAWKQAAEKTVELLRQIIKVVYDEEVPAGASPATSPAMSLSLSTSSSSSLAAAAVATPTAPPTEMPLLRSCSGVEEEPAKAEEAGTAEPQELAELRSRYENVRSERNELQARVVLLQGQNAKLQAAADAAQQRGDVGTAEARAERRAWLMFVAAVLVLLAVIIYAIARTIPRVSPLGQ